MLSIRVTRNIARFILLQNRKVELSYQLGAAPGSSGDLYSDKRVASDGDTEAQWQIGGLAETFQSNFLFPEEGSRLGLSDHLFGLVHHQ